MPHGNLRKSRSFPNRTVPRSASVIGRLGISRWVLPRVCGVAVRGEIFGDMGRVGTRDHDIMGPDVVRRSLGARS